MSLRLLGRGDTLARKDNHNSWYDPAVKAAQLAPHAGHSTSVRLRLNLPDKKTIEAVFPEQQSQRARYSLETSLDHLDKNIAGFTRILEGCCHSSVDHLVYACTSNVYPATATMPFTAHYSLDPPFHPSAPTKISDKLLAYTYSPPYHRLNTRLGFFVVYHPLCRPDRNFTIINKAILGGERIQLSNYGKHRRNLTYIHDTAETAIRMFVVPTQPNRKRSRFGAPFHAPIWLQARL